MQSAAALLAPDADFVNVGGRWLRGRGEFHDYHVHLHAMQMRNSTWSNQALTVRALSADVAVAHLEDRRERLTIEGLYPRVAAVNLKPQRQSPSRLRD